jgi:hypothetical protein
MTEQKVIELVAVSENLGRALQLAKDMMIINDLYLPKTFEVIDEAIEGLNDSK